MKESKEFYTQRCQQVMKKKQEIFEIPKKET